MRHENPTDPAMGSALKAGGLLVLAFPLALALRVLDPGAVASAASGDVIETIPLWSCPSCGESYFTAQTLHEIERIKALRKSVSVRKNVSVAAFEPGLV